MTAKEGSMSLGKRLRRLRIERGLTQRELADPLYTHAYVSTIEAGRRQPSPAALDHFAAKLDIAPSELLTGTPADLPARLEMRLSEARIAVSTGDIGDAEREFSRIRREAAAHDLKRLGARAEHGSGLCAERGGRLEEAIERYERAETLLKEEPATARVDAVVGKARCFQFLGDTRYSTYLLESLLETLQRQGLTDPTALLALHAPLVSIYFEGGLYKKAAEAAAEAMRLAPRVEDPFRLAVMNVNVARVFLQHGQVDEATGALRRAQEMFGQLTLKTELARAHLALGFVQVRENEFEGARTSLEQALSIARETSNRLDEAYSLQELARVDRVTGRVVEGRALIERAIELVEPDDDVAFAGICYRELALCTVELEPAVAEKSLRSAIELFERAESPGEIAVTYRILGDLQTTQGDAAGACDSFRTGIMALEHSL
jgi:tetratricopeptide (TPR) repeat protein